MCLCPDSTDVPTIYWRVNSSSLDGALLLDFITQGPSYEPFIHIGLLRQQGRIQDFVLGGAYRMGMGACPSKLARVSGNSQ